MFRGICDVGARNTVSRTAFSTIQAWLLKDVTQLDIFNQLKAIYWKVILIINLEDIKNFVKTFDILL